MMVESRNIERSEMLNFVKVIIITIIVTFAMYKFHPLNKEPLVKSVQFSLLGPYDEYIYETHDVYNQLIDIKNFTFKMNPQPCSSSNNRAGLLLVIIISSKPDHFDQRKLIRNTWGRSYDSTKVVFLMGESDNKTLTKKIETENHIYRDIVLGTFRDTYRNLTYKHTMGLKWVAHHCPKARYVLKTDDDVVIHSVALRKFLVRELSPWGAHGLITCSIFWRSIVDRQAGSKWMVLKEEYSGKYYPRYCAGYSILYSRDVVEKLLSQVQTIPYFWIDDVHITGVAAEMQKINHTPFQSLILSNSRSKTLMSLGHKHVPSFIFGPQQLSVNVMKAIWNALPQ